jgi:hypothetical protein
VRSPCFSISVFLAYLEWYSDSDSNILSKLQKGPPCSRRTVGVAGVPSVISEAQIASPKDSGGNRAGRRVVEDPLRTWWWTAVYGDVACHPNFGKVAPRQRCQDDGSQRAEDEGEMATGRRPRCYRYSEVPGDSRLRKAVPRACARPAGPDHIRVSNPRPPHCPGRPETPVLLTTGPY